MDLKQELSDEQGGVIAFWQLDPAQRKAARRLVKKKLWRRITHRVLGTSSARPTITQELWAGVLHCGPNAVVAGRNALVLHGWRDELSRPVHVAVPINHKPPPGPQWLRVHRIERLPTSRRNLPVVEVHDAAAQAAAWARSDRDAMYVLVSAMQQGMVDPMRLRALVGMQRTRLHRRGVILAVIDEFVGGAQSLSEIDLGSICRRHGLPEPIRQVKRVDADGRVRAIDCEFMASDGTRVRVEVEGLQHLNPEAWFKDLRRHNGLVRSGDGAYYRYSAWEIRHDDSDFVKEMSAVLLKPSRRTA